MCVTTCSPCTPGKLAGAIQLAEEAHCCDCSWQPNDFKLDLYTCWSVKHTTEIDVMPTLGHNVKQSARRKRYDKRYWFPKKFRDDNQETRNEELLSFINTAPKGAMHAGFELRISEFKKDVLYLRCRRGILHRLNQSRKKEKEATQDSNETEASPTGREHAVSTTGLPTRLEDVCHFRMAVHYDPDRKRWYLPEKQAGNPTHHAHLAVTMDIATARKDDLSQSEKQIQEDMIASKAAPSVHDNVVVTRNGFQYTKNQFKHMRNGTNQKVVDNPILEGFDDGTGKKGWAPKTPADRLLHDLDNDPTITYVALYASFDSGHLRIRKKRKSKKNRTFTDIDPSTVDGDPTTTVEMEAEKLRAGIRKRLKVTAIDCILLAVAWTDDESRLKFDLFPELLYWDTVAKTNREGRNLSMWCLLDSNWNSATAAWILLPSEQLWIHKWSLSAAIPALLNKEALEKVQVVITDQDGQINQALEDHTGPGTPFPNATPRLCSWHKLDRNLVMHRDFRGLIDKVEREHDKNHAEWNALVTWLWQLCKAPETEYEGNLMVLLLELYLDGDSPSHRGSVGKQLIKKLREFMVENFNPVREKLMPYPFHLLLCFDRISSQIAEVENAALKGHCYAPTPKDSIDTMHSKVAVRTKQRNREKRHHANRELNAVPSCPEIREKTVLQVTRKANEVLQEQYDLSEDLCVCIVSESRAWVKTPPVSGTNVPDDGAEADPLGTNVPDSPAVGGDDAWEALMQQQKDFLLPKLRRTRIVDLVWQEEECFMTCSCGFDQRWGLTCRHMFAVMEHKPTKMDAKVRWWKTWANLVQGDLIPLETRSRMAELYQISMSRGGMPSPSPSMLKEFLPNGKGVYSAAEGVLALPEEYFARTLERPEIAPVGFWGTSLGIGIAEEAIRILEEEDGDGLREFGLVVERKLPARSYLNLPEIQQSEEDNGFVVYDEEDDDATVDATVATTQMTPSPERRPCVDPMSPLDPQNTNPRDTNGQQMSPKPSLDKHITSKMCQELSKSKNIYSAMLPQFQRMCGLAQADPEMAERFLKMFHYTEHDMLERMAMKDRRQQAGTASLPQNAMGKKRSNKRTKRSTEVYRKKQRSTQK